jgi:hypothetical protein
MRGLREKRANQTPHTRPYPARGGRDRPYRDKTGASTQTLHLRPDVPHSGRRTTNTCIPRHETAPAQSHLTAPHRCISCPCYSAFPTSPHSVMTELPPTPYTPSNPLRSVHVRTPASPSSLRSTKQAPHAKPCRPCPLRRWRCGPYDTTPTPSPVHQRKTGRRAMLVTLLSS